MSQPSDISTLRAELDALEQKCDPPPWNGGHNYGHCPQGLCSPFNQPFIAVLRNNWKTISAALEKFEQLEPGPLPPTEREWLLAKIAFLEEQELDSDKKLRKAMAELEAAREGRVGRREDRRAG